jgi:hypothetical protein
MIANPHEIQASLEKGDYSISLLHLIPNLGSNSDRYIKIYNGHHSPAESRKQKAESWNLWHFPGYRLNISPITTRAINFHPINTILSIRFLYIYIYIYMEKMKKKHLLNNVCSINFKLEELCI